MTDDPLLARAQRVVTRLVRDGRRGDARLVRQLIAEIRLLDEGQRVMLTYQMRLLARLRKARAAKKTA